MKSEAMAARSTIVIAEKEESKLCPFFFEYETPKLVTIQSVPLGILRLILQTLVLVFVFAYQLWYSQGYQVFTEGETCVITKVKGLSM